MLEVSLLLDGHEPAPGQILDLSHAGAGIGFDTGSVPRLRSGDAVELEFLVCGTGRRIVCEAVVQYCGEDAGGHRYGFLFLDSTELREHLDSGLLRLFNRRRKVRVRPCASETIAVELDDGVTTAQGALLNISETGLAVRLPLGTRQELYGARSLDVSLALPGRAQPLRVNAALRYQSAEMTSERWGLEFHEPTPEAIEAVQGYVEHRLRAITENRPHAA